MYLTVGELKKKLERFEDDEEVKAHHFNYGDEPEDNEVLLKVVALDTDKDEMGDFPLHLFTEV